MRLWVIYRDALDQMNVLIDGNPSPTWPETYPFTVKELLEGDIAALLPRLSPI